MVGGERKLSVGWGGGERTVVRVVDVREGDMLDDWKKYDVFWREKL